MSEPESRTTPYMANCVNSLDPTVAQDIWLDWDSEAENENDSDNPDLGSSDRVRKKREASKNVAFAVDIKQEPGSPSEDIPKKIPESYIMKHGPTYETSVNISGKTPKKVECSEEPVSFKVSENSPISDHTLPIRKLSAVSYDEVVDEAEDDDGANYNCHFCFRGFNTKEELREHVKFTHTANLSLRCDPCDLNFQHKYDYFYHLSQHDSEKHLRCDRCLVTFSSERKFTEHVLNEHFSGSKYVCEYCELTFAFKEEILAHKYEEHSGSDGYSCDHCGTCFARKDLLEMHISRFHVGHVHKCRVCPAEYGSKASLMQHARKHNQNLKRKFFCKLCTTYFRNEKTRALHSLVCIGRNPDRNEKPVKEEKAVERKGCVEKPLIEEHSIDNPCASKSEADLLNVSRVVFDGEKIVTCTQPKTFCPVSEMLLGGVALPDFITPVKSAQRVTVESETSDSNSLGNINDSSKSVIHDNITLAAIDNSEYQSSVKSSTDDPNFEGMKQPENRVSKQTEKISSDHVLSKRKHRLLEEATDNDVSSNSNLENLAGQSDSILARASPVDSNSSNFSIGGLEAEKSRAVLSDIAPPDDRAMIVQSGSSLDETVGFSSSPNSSNDKAVCVELRNTPYPIVKNVNLLHTSNVEAYDSPNPRNAFSRAKSATYPSSSSVEEVACLNVSGTTGSFSSSISNPPTKSPVFTSNGHPSLRSLTASPRASEKSATLSLSKGTEICKAVSKTNKEDFNGKRRSEVLNENSDEYISEESPDVEAKIKLELPDKCAGALSDKRQYFSRTHKKPRLLSENINQALTYRVVRNLENFTCDVCKAEFAFKYDLLKHKKTQHIAHFQCDRCPAVFVKKEELAQHTLDLHFRSSSRHGCNLLANLFTDKLAKARASPSAPPTSSDQTFTCKNCDLTFGYEMELLYHQQIHGDAFKCNKCKASFREKCELAKHMLSTHF